MQKTEKTLAIGDWKLTVFPDRTRRAYQLLAPYTGSDVGVRMFHFLWKNVPEETAAFLDSIGVDGKKILCARPLSEVQEDGTVLFYAKARLCGEILLHSMENGRRKSEEVAGLSVVFVSRKEEFCPDYPPFSAPEIELRMVLALPFDPAFFDYA